MISSPRPSQVNDHFISDSPERPRQRRDSQGSAGSMESSTAGYTERKLTRLISSLKAEIGTDLDSVVSDDLIIDLYSNVLPTVLRLSKECDDKCAAYDKLADHREDLVLQSEDATKAASLWIVKLRQLYRNRQLHLQTGSNKSFVGTINLKKFSGDSTQTVFEFFKRFDELTKRGLTNEQRVMMLHSNYLDDKIRQEVIAFASSYVETRKFLCRKYGRPRTIIDSKLESIRTRKPSTGAGFNAIVDHVRFVYSVVSEIKNLPISSDISKEAMAMHAYSQESLSKIFLGLPPEIVTELLFMLEQKGHESEFFEGESAFLVIHDYLKLKYGNLSVAAKLSAQVDKVQPASRERSKQESRDNATSTKKKVNTVARARSVSSSDSEPEDPSVYFQTGSTREKNKQKSSAPQAKKNSKPKEKWYDSTYKFPCPIKNHTHELGSCIDFFRMDPK